MINVILLWLHQKKRGFNYFLNAKLYCVNLKNNYNFIIKLLLFKNFKLIIVYIII